MIKFEQAPQRSLGAARDVSWVVFFIKQMSRSKSALLLIVLLTIFITAASAAAPLYIGRIVDDITLRDGNALLRYALLLAAVFLCTQLFNSIRSLVSTRAMQSLTYELSLQTLTAVFRTSAHFFTKTARGELLQRIVQDTRMIQQFGLVSLPSLIQAALLGCTAIVVISRIYWPVAVMIVLTYVVLFIPVHIFGTKRGSVRQQLIRHNALIRQSLLEKLESYKQIKIFGIERKEHEQFSKEQKQWAELTFQENLLTDAFKGFPRIPDSLAPALVFLFVGWQVAAGQATIGELMTVIAFIPAINNPVRLFFMLYITFADIRIRIRGIMEYIQLAEEPGRRDGLLQPADLRNRTISFQDVSVDGNHGPLLKNLTFSIAPGEYVSIVGPSGSGKSTLLKLLTRLQEPSSGEILIGETPLCIMDATCLRQRIGYMTQEGFIFNASLRSNLTYLQPDAPQTLIDGWMQALGAADIVTKLPHGYDTLLGDRGSVLSGGQRQLIGLARTMLKQPDIVLLDEVTSALDQASEAIVYDALNKYTEAAGLTRIAVTHRLQAAVHADRILVVQHGELVEQGTHEALLSLPAGLYARLWHSQLMEQADHSSSLKEEDADAIAIV